MRISVTANHIKHGVRGNAEKCPVALACQAAFGGPARVFGGRVFIGGRLMILPKRADEFIARFDYRKRVNPFTFTLRAPK